MYKKRKRTFKLSNIVLAVMAIVAVLLLLATILISLNLNKDKKNLSIKQETNISLQQKLDNLAPNKITLPAGKFPLEANEKLLETAYLRLMAFVYQKSDSEKPFKANKNTLVQYFGKSGYEQLKQETILHDGLKIKSLSNKLLSCKIAFSNFDLNTKTVNVTIYCNYQLADPSQSSKTGISVINLKYNFDNLSVSDFDMHSANVDKQSLF